MALRYCIILFISSIILFGQTAPPKREFRGVWVATVSNLDWPTTKNNVTAQKSELTLLFDSMAVSGMNAVIFQVRPAADAFFISSLEPWSYWLTNTQGLAPSPLYDPLTFAISEAHKRGMELHAWFNPYRAVNGTYTLAASHVVNQHPDWILTVGAGQKKILNPGLPAVRAHVLNVISDVIRRYDIDGVHMDDYFYPYPSDNITTEDTATFRLYSRGFSNINDWRRDNVNILIRAIQDSVNAIKPKIKFGMSPFGIWKNGVPSGITGLDAYSTIFCDGIAWLQAQSVDYLTPQLYWKIGGSQDYLKLLTWWADSAAARQRHFYPGQTFGSGYTNSELPAQIRLNRADAAVGGNILFRAATLKSNNLNFKDSLQQTYFKYPALMPVMTWKDNTPPRAPVNLAASNAAGKIQLNWLKPSAAADGDTAHRFVLYRSASTVFDFNDPRNIVELTNNDTTSFTDQTVVNGQKYYYYATSLDRSANESAVSNITFATAGSANSVLADFEGGVGLFDRNPTYSGSTYGISRFSTQALSTEFAHGGTGALKLIFKDSTTTDTSWRVRILSGSGTVGNNTALPPNGSIQLWIKTSTAAAGAKAAITLDDAAGGTELSPQIEIINDGQWHLYTFDFQSAGWTSFASGNGKIDGPTVTLDAVMFYSPNTSNDWISYLDDIGYNSSGTPLPVELQLFTAEARGGSVLLRWVTATEVNNAGFTVERREENSSGNRWTNIGFVHGGGTSSSPREYTFTDTRPIPNTKTYYRLRQTDNDGSEMLSAEVEVMVRGMTFELAQNYPNPFNPETAIRFTLNEPGMSSSLSPVTLRVYDALGREVVQLVNEPLAPGAYTATFDGAAFPSGVYFYELRLNNFRAVKKMTLLK